MKQQTQNSSKQQKSISFNSALVFKTQKKATIEEINPLTLKERERFKQLTTIKL